MSKNTKEYQKEASRKHYLANKQAYLARASAKKLELVEYVRNLKATTPCADCNKIYPPYVMDFDHLPEYEKIREINKLVHQGASKMLRDEIKKCEIVCSNCHRIRTYNRMPG